MPALYGEGQRAFRRLQEEIMRRIPDQSLFAWGDVLLASSHTAPERTPAAKKHNHAPPQVICYTNDSESHSILATRPSIFGAHSGTIRAASPDTLSSICGLIQTSQIEYTSTPYGIRTQFQVIPLSQCVSPGNLDYIQYVDDEMRTWQWYLAILGCEHEDYPGNLLGKICYIPPSTTGVDFLYSGCISTGSLGSGFQYPHLIPLSPRTIALCCKHIQLKTVHIPHPDPEAFLDTGIMPYKALALVLLRETRDALAQKGYTATLRGPDQDHPATHRLELSSHRDTISVAFQHALQSDGRAFTVTAHASTNLKCREDIVHEGDQRDHPPSRRTATVSWSDESNGFLEWDERLGPARVELGGGGATQEPVALHLGLEFAGMGFYLLRVDVLSPPPASAEHGSRGEGPLGPGDAQKGSNGGWGRVFRKPVRSWLRLKSQPQDGLAKGRLKEGDGLCGT